MKKSNHDFHEISVISFSCKLEKFVCHILKQLLALAAA